tara:strand:- start:6359 stop:7207 length:849 start_codon:yes stop_codon:yes gene_type:complete
MENNLSVFGSTGYIGSNYCNLYPEECIAIPKDSLKPETNNVLYFISTIHNYNIFENPLLDIETNLIHLIKVLESCKANEDIVFNFISSWFVYGKTGDLPANEKSECNPTGFYSITKRAAEQMLISYCETFKLKYRILRLCNVYGGIDKKASKKKNALQHLSEEIMSHRDINIYSGGNNIRDFLHVEDACRAINLAVHNAELNDTINIGSGIPYKFKDLMEYVKEKSDSSSDFISIDPPEFHKIVQVENMYLDISKLNNLGFQPKYSIWKGLDQIIENFQDKK